MLDVANICMYLKKLLILSGKNAWAWVMAVQVVEFSSGGYKIRKIFA